jgi:hypothetical protein
MMYIRYLLPLRQVEDLLFERQTKIAKTQNAHGKDI